ncbi:MAG: copper-binding protein [Hyphomicrobiaceae bacterium]
MKTTAIVTIICAPLMLSGAALAQHSGHAGHTMATENTGEVKAKAVVHKVDTAKGMINVTHDPVPALKWPQMTMDLPVTKKVDLSKLKAGDKVTITLKQGVDKQFRVTNVDMAH